MNTHEENQHEENQTSRIIWKSRNDPAGVLTPYRLVSDGKREGERYRLERGTVTIYPRGTRWVFDREIIAASDDEAAALAEAATNETHLEEVE